MYAGGCSGYEQPFFYYITSIEKRPINGQKSAYRSIIKCFFMVKKRCLSYKLVFFDTLLSF